MTFRFSYKGWNNEVLTIDVEAWTEELARIEGELLLMNTFELGQKIIKVEAIK